MVLVLDTVAATTLAAPYGQNGQWSVEATIKSVAGFHALQDLHDGLVAQGKTTLEARKALFVTRVALALVAEREAAHEEALATRPATPATTPCDGGCFGGQRLLSGCIENGKPKGAMGVCYRCGGKGHQTPADVRRNRYYDNHVRRVYA